ncbi:MAG: pyridoxal-phosphate dependent enzyme [Candidatus Lokiarchaeota archaeon]|nr:pyridoxal-phosphate dependent enzyme [Candidatus Lokiarchaeota archaeon]
MKFIMRCTNTRCNAVFTDEEKTPLTCPKCESPLNVHIFHDKVVKIDLDFFRSRTPTMWKFLPFLPITQAENIVTIGEGATPLLQANNINEDLNIKNLLLKNETINPTGSYIDRQISLGISVAKELGYVRAISLSTGNVGASVAAYSARAGFKSLCIVPSHYKAPKLQQIKFFGGNVIQVKSDSDKELMDIVVKGSRAFKAINLATTSLYNAFTNHGAKTIIYEIFEQMHTELPDLIVVPVGGGALFSALLQACLELKELHFIGELPRFLVVQPEGCHPFIDALEGNLTPEQVFQNPWKDVRTEISALAHDVPLDYGWFHLLKTQLPKADVVQGITVSDAETRSAQRLLSKREGIFVELASATVIAALLKASQHSDGLSQYNSVCPVLTGSGIMGMDREMEVAVPDAFPVGFDWEAVMRRFLA